ncbi:MAG: protein-methionine-sulfoxide reductase catalytic subunit MsrP [Gammaproteobacteria bacterium]|nr:protein-methionine-sulfoxide reductase catalytic subunit MsrP [Gammaproteobacteria bacterium]
MPRPSLPYIPPSEITAERHFQVRRELLAGALGLAGAALLPGRAVGTAAAPALAPLHFTRNARYRVADPLNSYEEIITYNNFYEFGVDKTDPAANSGSLRTRPWTLSIAGEAEVTGTFHLEDILRQHPLEERIYRHRCVEAWSMVIPWVGFPLADLLKRFRPTSSAKFVEFTTLLDPRQMPGQRSGLLDWPYREGLRIDEAMHPLALMVVGVYGRELPNQNGAPLRVHLPWKYGFKSGKSIVRIRFTARRPLTSWPAAFPGEYGFYANVNPRVDHPRWSQATERRIGASLFGQRRPTEMFNGYGEQVAELYRGLDLRSNF